MNSRQKEAVERAIDALEHLGGDPEGAHEEADEILVALLRATGHNAVANAYKRAKRRLPFWYG